ncbi:MAG: hypothetical protein KF912_15435 [Phycisphaeraceae bacterium]|nr:hypothetical protein [Phycisphaeraceae bacterium]
MRYPFRTRLEWRKWVVPEPLRSRPVHRWLVFPHSFTDDIVRALAEEWQLGANDILLDPFAGAGTTVLAAKQLGIPAVGCDLSPLAILATRVKVAKCDTDELQKAWSSLRKHVKVRHANGEAKTYPELVRIALPGKKLATFHGVKSAIAELDASPRVRSYLLLALIRQIPHFSNAVPTGGWLSWRPNRRPAASLADALSVTVAEMVADLGTAHHPRGGWSARSADARSLPLEDESVSAVITSPPYPNRHDYTRVFGVELMFGFLDWEKTRALRYQMMHSHPEARPKRPAAPSYSEPRLITDAVRQIAKQEERERLVAMLHGYFLDLYLSMREMARVLKPSGRAALVLGNAQYDGVPIEVDKATALIARQAGLHCEEIRVVRERGNSAQQMKRHGRSPARESVVICVKDK